MGLIKKILLSIFFLSFNFIDIKNIYYVYIGFCFFLGLYSWIKGYRNEIVLAVLIFGFSFFARMTNLTGIPCTLIIMIVMFIMFILQLSTRWRGAGRLKLPKKIINIVFLFFLITIIFSMLFTVFSELGSYRVKLFFIFGFTFIIAFNALDQSIIYSFNFQVFLIIIFFLFLPHFTVVGDRGGSSSPIAIWKTYSVISSGLRYAKTDVIAASRISGVGILIILMTILKFGKKYLYLISLIFPFLILIIVSQTRQGLLSSLVVFSLFVIYQTYVSKKGVFRVLGLTLLVFVLLFNSYQSYVQQTGGGGSRIIDEQSSTGRDKIASRSLDYYAQNDGLIGFGNFKEYTGIAVYPHNLFLEVLIEEGIVSLILLVMIVVFSFIHFVFLFRLKGRPFILLCLPFLSLYYLIVAQVSSDLSRNLGFFFYVLLSISISTLFKNNQLKR